MSENFSYFNQEPVEIPTEFDLSNKKDLQRIAKSLEAINVSLKHLNQILSVALDAEIPIHIMVDGKDINC